MTLNQKIFFSIIFAFLLFPLSTAQAAKENKAPASYYNYAHDDAEYSVMLPEAPRVKTIWAESPETTPFLKDPPDDSSALGEIATFRRADIDTEELFDVKITFLKAKRSFLEGLTREKIKAMLSKPEPKPQVERIPGADDDEVTV